MQLRISVYGFCMRVKKNKVQGDFMQYDITNTILYNRKGVYFKVNSYQNGRLGISQIKKPSDNAEMKLLSIDALQDGRISIVYEPSKKR